MGVSGREPWLQDPAVLRQRTVGLEALLRRLRLAADELAGGGQPLPLYLFGPPSAGTSHLAALARAELVERGLVVRYVPDDIPAVRTADELLRAGVQEIPAWARWRGDGGEDASPPQADALIVEGLDRRLAELGAGASGHVERQRVRGAWSEQRLWVLGTGQRLGTELTAHHEPLYGWFDPEPVERLDDAQARALLERSVPAALRRDAGWTARRDTWLAAAMGAPQILLALAEGCAAPQPCASANDGLEAAVERFAARSRAAFRALSPISQHIAMQLALAPRAMTPGELAVRAGTSPQSLATQARRLADDGVLERAEEGRSTWYTLADPMLRYWLESRDCPWAQTRVAQTCALLEADGHRIADVEGGTGLRQVLLAQLTEERLHPELARLASGVRRGATAMSIR